MSLFPLVLWAFVLWAFVVWAFVLWAFVLWAFVVWAFVLWAFVVWAFVLWAYVRAPHNTHIWWEANVIQDYNNIPLSTEWNSKTSWTINNYVPSFTLNALNRHDPAMLELTQRSSTYITKQLSMMLKFQVIFLLKEAQWVDYAFPKSLLFFVLPN